MSKFGSFKDSESHIVWRWADVVTMERDFEKDCVIITFRRGGPIRLPNVTDAQWLDIRMNLGVSE